MNISNIWKIKLAAESLAYRTSPIEAWRVLRDLQTKQVEPSLQPMLLRQWRNETTNERWDTLIEVATALLDLFDTQARLQEIMYDNTANPTIKALAEIQLADIQFTIEQAERIINK